MGLQINGFTFGSSTPFHVYFCTNMQILLLWLCSVTWKKIPPTLLVFLRIALATVDLLCFHINFRTFFSSCMRNVIESLRGNVFNLWIDFNNSLNPSALSSIMFPQSCGKRMEYRHPIYSRSLQSYLVSTLMAFLKCSLLLFIRI